MPVPFRRGRSEIVSLGAMTSRNFRITGSSPAGPNFCPTALMYVLKLSHPALGAIAAKRSG